MTTQQVWTGLWDAGSWVWLVAAAMVAVYGRAVGWRFGRQSAPFFAGVAALVLALVSPLATLAGGYVFSAHMAQHLVLLLLVPPLLLLGAPSRLVGRRSGRWALVERALARPWLTWLAGIGVMWFWHIPRLCAGALHDPILRHFQFATLVLAGSAFMWPILAPNPARRLDPGPAIAYLVVGCIGCTALGIWITFSPVSVCPGFYRPADPGGPMALVRGGWGLDPRLDQQLAGLLMWVPACLCYLSGVLFVLGRAYAPSARAQVPHAA